MLLALVLACAVQEPDPFQRVVGQVAEARYQVAYEGAQALEEGIQRHQALVYVLYQGGDLGQALIEARAGLEAHPRNTWLLDQAVQLCASLGAGELGLALAQRLEVVAGESGDHDLQVRARELAQECGTIRELELATVRASTKARWVVLLGVAATTLALVAALRVRD